jgi:hypothetical protein
MNCHTRSRTPPSRTRVLRSTPSSAGIGQFLDIGTGLPAASNTHEVAQGVAPQSRVVYVDNDPIVLLHARALLASSPEPQGWARAAR